MAIKFKYKIPENLLPLMKDTIENFNSDCLNGYVPEWAMYDLRHCSLYMICEFEFKDDNSQVWREPVVVVGSNSISAIETYAEITNKENGSILCEVLNNCEYLTIEECE